MNGDGKRVVEEWSVERSEIFKNGNINTNRKFYRTKPNIVREDWDAAWKWDEKKHLFCQVYHDGNIFMGSETIVGPDKAYCRKYLNDSDK